jgi:hypothetical protein
VAKVTQVTPATADAGPARNAILEVNQSIKGDNGAQLTVLWMPDLLLHAEGTPLPTTPPAVGDVRLFMLQDDPYGGPARVLKMVAAEPAQQIAVTTLVKRCNLAAQIVLPGSIPPATGELEALLRLTNRGEQAVRICTRVSPDREDSATFSGAGVSVGAFLSDTPPMSDYAKYVVSLAPGQWLDLPIDFPLSETKMLPIRLMSSYSVWPEYGKALGLPPIYVQAPAVMLEK